MADSVKVIAKNKKARHDYFIEETYECGIVLAGTEVKSLRQGKASLKESHADIKDGEVYVYQMTLTSTGISTTKTPCARESCSCISSRFASLLGLSSARAIPWCLCPCILKTDGLSLSWHWQRVKNSMINGTPSQSGTLTGVSRKTCGTAFSFQRYPNGDVKVSTGMLKLE